MKLFVLQLQGRIDNYSKRPPPRPRREQAVVIPPINSLSTPTAPVPVNNHVMPSVELNEGFIEGSVSDTEVGYDDGKDANKDAIVTLSPKLPRRTPSGRQLRRYSVSDYMLVRMCV